MNTDSFTINNMFVGTTGAAPIPSKSHTSEKTTRFSLIRDDKSSQIDTPETDKTYNTLAESLKEPIKKPLENFNQALGKKTTTEGPCKAKDSTKSREQSTTSNTAKQPNVVQTCLTEQFITGYSKKGTAIKIEAKAGGQLAQLIANLRAEKSPVTGQASKSAEIKLLRTTNKGQLGLKTVLHNTSKGAAITNAQLGEDKNSGQIPISNNTVVDLKVLTNGGNAKESMPEVPVNGGSKTPAAGNKPAITNTLAVADTGKISVSSTKQLIPETPIDGSSKTTTAGEKTPSVNTNASAVLTKPNQPNFPPIGINPEESAPTAEKSKAAAPQILSESSVNNGKESSLVGKNLSDESTAQKLNVTEVQISTGQIKTQNNSSSHNRANSGLEQIFSHNNPQITEQSLTSVETAKTANLQGQTSPSNVSADIGKQILESIHSSLSQKGGDRQISIRLNPPELGKVFIKFQEQDSQLTGLLEVSKTQTRVEIEQALPQIIRNLTDYGIQIKRLEVVLSNGEQSEQGAFKDQLLQNGGAQQQDSENPSAWGNDPDTNGINQWLTNSNSYRNISELQEAIITDGSINMLI